MNYSQEEKEWLWLASIENVGIVAFKKILSYYNGDVIEARKRLRSDVGEIGLNIKVQKSIYKRYEGSSPNQYVEILNEKGITALTLSNDKYPESLKQIYNPPLVLFCKGNIDVLSCEKKIAVVGTRKPTRYGALACEKVCEGLAASGVCIVSGMARGIDSLAHKAALEVGAPTIAVLGCGVDVIYPRENKKIYDEIVKTGVVISEYPLGIQPLPGFFPARNRIVSGLSEGVLVVEAAQKSGTQITVDHAQSQGREVLAIPGNITSDKSATPNSLIRDGAAVVTSYKDILSWFGWKEQGAVTDSTTAPSFGQLNMQEIIVVRLLERGEAQFDEVLAEADFTAPQLTAILVTMEIKGIIDKLPGNKYALKGR